MAKNVKNTVWGLRCEPRGEADVKEFRSFYKSVGGNEGGKCRYNTRLDTYGCGCAHDCAYCYAKSLLSFRGLWNAESPRVADISKIKKRIETIQPGAVVRLGGMTDCFQPMEAQEKVTQETIKALNARGVGYLIVTKSDLVCDYMGIMDKDLAHVQISTTWLPFENAVSTSRRIAAVETLQENGFDVAVRLSPYVPEFVDYDALNAIKCNKIIIEFLRVNHWVMKWMPMDYSEYTAKHAGYLHLPLEKKLQALKHITGFNEVSVCDDVDAHYNYFRDNVNHNKNDCCNLRINKKPGD